MWSLYENEKELKPLVFSNGKTQADVVKEVLDAIKAGYKMIFIKGACGTGKCLDKDSLIFCKPDDEEYFSYYKIMDLVGKKGKILSLDKKGKIVESRFKNVRETGVKEIFRLKTNTGRQIFASKNHPFLSINEKGLEWIPIEKLAKKSYICLANKIHLTNIFEYDENKIKILAHLIAEGKLGDKSGSPIYTQDPLENPDTREDYIQSLRKVFPEGEIKQDKKNVKINFRIMDTRFGTTNKLRLFVREHGLDGKRSAEKFVPKIIFNLSNEKIALFLRVLYSGDGSIYSRKIKKRKQDQIIIEYCSISDRLIRDVSILLSRFGIQHTITSKKFRENNDYSKRIVISSQEQVRTFIEKIGFLGRKQKLALELYDHTKIHKFTNIDKVPRIIREYLKEKGYSYLQLDRFLNYESIENLRKDASYKKIRIDNLIKSPKVFSQGKIDFLRVHLKKINNHIKDESLSFICNEDIIWDKIKSIDPVKNGKTYDLEVEDNHNFIANGIMTHNSAIALNLARKLGKTSVVVPIKSLQEQYLKDYTGKMHIFKEKKFKLDSFPELSSHPELTKSELLNKKEKLKICSIVGRGNFKCKYLEENPTDFTIKREKNSTLTEVFEPSKNQRLSMKSNDKSCDNDFIPCKIDLKEKNLPIIKEYIKLNPDVELTDFESVGEIKRMTIAPVCPYWSPILPVEIGRFKDAVKINYNGLNSKKFIIHQRKPGCKYYEQYASYNDSDVIIFNSLKYKLETLMDRKPETELEIIDECDEFLDSFTIEEQINLNRLVFALNNVFSGNKKVNDMINNLLDITNTIKLKYKDSIQEEILELKNTIIEDLLNSILEESEAMDLLEMDERNYIYHLDEVAKTFSDFHGETFFSINSQENNIVISLVTTNLEKRFKELAEKNKVFVMMSGTIHSESVLKNIYGLDKFKIIEAETAHQGELIKLKQGYELECSYANFKNNKITREDYLKALSKSVASAKPPILVHVNSFSDLPKEFEKEKYRLDNLITQEQLLDEQQNDPLGQRVKDFKNKKTNILFTTKCSRGMDFPGDICNSIIITRFPYPNISSIFWKILKKTNPNNFMSFYMDKAHRELLQRIYRGLRSKNDTVYLLSPDIRVLDHVF